MIHSRFIAILVDPESRVSLYFFFYCVFFFIYMVQEKEIRETKGSRYLVEKGPKDVG